jgi:adenosylhomocysteine nucleosidase
MFGVAFLTIRYMLYANANANSGDIMKHNKLTLMVLTCSTLLFTACNSELKKSASQSPSPTAILGAMPEEVEMLEGQLSKKNERSIEGIKFTDGQLMGRNVVIAQTGTGKVNAAMAAAILIENFHPKQVIFTGIAGAVNPQLSPGDIVIAEKTAQHDSGILTSSGLENKGAVSPITGRVNPVFFPADPALLQLAEYAAKNVALKKTKTSEGEKSPGIMKGVVVTGDIFVASPEKCEELRKTLGANAVEMEGAAVAQVCYQLGIPCIVIRSISDNANEKAAEDMEKFYKIAAMNSASMVVGIVENLSPSPEPTVQKHVKKRHK